MRHAESSTASRPTGVQQRPAVTTDTDVVIVGAGFGGLYAAHRMRSDGRTVIGFETAPEVGGTWYWNRYPGARCDLPSPYYSYTWSPEVRQEWKWSEFHATQPEILRYAQYVADKYDLRSSFHFETRVVAATFDEAATRWIVETDRGDLVRARYLIMATGNLSAPHAPDIPGLESFAGETYFTATWPHEDVDFAGKRVGVIGTGSSGIQVIPIIAEDADHLTVFQRTPNFSLPARNHELTATERQRMEEYLPEHVASLDRGRVSDAAFDAPVPSREKQWARYEKLWGRGGADFLAGAYPNMLTDEGMNNEVSDFVRTKIHGLVSDPETARALSPAGYPFGVKRACVDTGYYETFNRPDVALVDLRREPIERVTADGITTGNGHYPLDSLVFATGFDAMTGALAAIDIRGRHGSLREAWEDGPKAYLGVTVAGFPNMFVLTGPGSLSVIGNVILNNEHHVEWVADLMSHADEYGITSIEADGEAETAWMAEVADIASRSLFMKANSWYLGANIPGKPRVFMPYVGSGYRARCAEVAGAGYPGLHLRRNGELRTDGQDYAGIARGTHVATGLEHVVFGRPAARAVRHEVKLLEKQRVFITSSRSLSGPEALPAQIAEALGSRHVGTFTDIPPHAPREAVIAGAAAALEAGADLLVAVGGGSVSDATKLMLLCLWEGLTRTDQLDDYLEGLRVLRDPARPAPGAEDKVRMLAVPTMFSAGEFTWFAGVTDTDRRVKDVAFHGLFSPRAVILDPAATLPTPVPILRSTGMKAVEHAVEFLCADQRSPLVEAVAGKSLALLLENLPRLGTHEDTIRVRMDCQFGSWYSIYSIAAGTEGGGASHSISHVLGALGVAHGDTTGVVLPAMLRWNESANGDQQAKAAALAGVDGVELADLVADLARSLGLPTRLREIGLTRAQLPEIADKALQDPMIGLNPRPITTTQDVMSILEAAW